jgi:hypothetical protein
LRQEDQLENCKSTEKASFPKKFKTKELAELASNIWGHQEWLLPD